MAVIKCPHCKKMMSSTLDVCPECGFDRTGSDEHTEDATTSTPHTKRWVITLVVLLVAVGGIVAGSLVYRSVMAEQKAYERLQGSANLLWYEQYMVQYPDGKHIDEVKELYAVVKQQHDLFYNEVYNGSREALLQYINENPESPYSKICEARLDSVDWQAALSENTMESYDRYLAFHPQGMFADAATDGKINAARMSVSDDEKSIIRGVVENFLLLMSKGDVQKLGYLLDEKFVLGNTPNAGADAVVAFFNEQFNKEDIQGVHFVVDSVINITKHESALAGQPDFNVQTGVSAMVSRTNVDSTIVQQMVLSANVASDHHFKTFSLKKK